MLRLVLFLLDFVSSFSDSGRNLDPNGVPRLAEDSGQNLDPDG